MMDASYKFQGVRDVDQFNEKLQGKQKLYLGAFLGVAIL